MTRHAGGPRVAVLRFPGTNCEHETVRALEAVGLDAEIVPWTAPPSVLRDVAALILPGGFSYEDRLRAGAIAAREPIVEAVVECAGAGRPVLGICNGAQVLVEAGLVPGLRPGAVEMGLAPDQVNGVARG